LHVRSAPKKLYSLSNWIHLCDVLYMVERRVNVWVETLKEGAESVDSASDRELRLKRELERRLAESSRDVYRVALGVLHNHADAEDVAQDALLRAYRHFARLRQPERLKPWLVRTAWRLAIDRMRSADRRERREHSVVAGGLLPATTEEIAGEQQFLRRLEAAVDTLPEKLRRVVILAAMEGYDMRETAQLLGVPEGTVRSRLNRARKLLAEKLR
jgi:RNA polymerase sigma-70 factor, ECF subfamily